MDRDFNFDLTSFKKEQPFKLIYGTCAYILRSSQSGIRIFKKGNEHLDLEVKVSSQGANPPRPYKWTVWVLNFV